MSSLTSEEFFELKEIYKNFKQDLKSAINNRNIINNKECYLIKKQWDTDIDTIFNNNSFNRFKSSRYSRSNISNNSINLPNEPPEIINDFKTLIECLKNGEQIILESKDLIESALGKYTLNKWFQKNYLVYSAKNNKIILEYPNKNELLLIENAYLIIDGISNKTKINKIAYHKNFRAKDSNKQEFIEYLLSNTNFKDLNLDTYKNYNSPIKITDTEIDILNEENKLTSSIEPNISSRRNQFRRFRNEEPKIQTKELILETPKENKEVENKGLEHKKRFHRTFQSTKNLNSTKDNTLQYEQNKETHDEPIIKSPSWRTRTILNKSEKNENLSTQSNINIEELKREIERLKKNNTSLTDTNNELKDNNKKLNKDAFNNQKEIARLNKDINSLNFKLKDKDKLIDKLQNDLKNINKEERNTKVQPQERKYFSGRSRIESTNQNQQSLDKDYQKNIDNLEKEKKSLLNKLKDLEKKYAEIEEKYQKENSENDTLYEENQNLKKKEKEYNKSIRELENKLQNNEKEYNKKLSKIEIEKNDKISKISYELEDKIKNNKEILKENDKLKDNEKKYLKQIKDFDLKEKNYLSKISEYESSINKKEKDFQKQINNLEKEKNDFEKKYLEIKEEYDKEYKENDDLYEENQNLKKKEKEYNKTIKELENKIQNNEKENNNKISKFEKENNENISKINFELNDKKNYIEELKKENEKLKKKEKENIEEIKNIGNKYQLELKESQNIINKLEYELKELKNKNNEINTEISYLYNENDSLKIKEKEYLDQIKKIEIKLKEKNDKNEKLNQKKLREINEKMIFLENKENELENEHQKIEATKKGLENEYQNIEAIKKELENEYQNIEATKKELEKIRKELEKQRKKIPEIPKYEEPTLIGLNNIGATCYLNSTLQCLSQTISLTKYFLNKKNRDKIINNNIAKKNKKALQLCPVYLELIENLWDKNSSNKSFSPNNFMNTIEAMNPLFKKGQAGDSKDFIIFILEQIHTELKYSVENNIEPKNPLNQYDKRNAFDHFFYDFKNEVSIISDIFFGFNETTNVCLNCKNNYNSRNLENPICYNYGIFNVIIFPLEEVKNMKNRNNFMMSNNNIVDINDCFYYNQKTDYFTGENKNYCNICRQLFDSEYTSKIYSGPNVLILILNRGKNNIYNVKINFKEEIDISQFVQMKDSTQVYELYGVITHLGESGPNAHFVASCKSPIDNNWYRYNDAMVNPIFNFMKEIHEFGKPYILFYQKKVNK